MAEDTNKQPSRDSIEGRNARPVKNVERNDNRKLRPGEIKWLELPEADRPKIGDLYKGVVVVSFDERGYPIGENSRNLVLGYVTKGNSLAKNGGGGRPKGSRNKLTQEMIEMVARQNVSPAEFLASVIGNDNFSLDNQIKAAMKLTDIVYPKAASVELEVVSDEPESLKDIDTRIAEALGNIRLSLDDSE